jgi:hypothetical protein
MADHEARGISRRRFLQGTAAASLGPAATAVGIRPAAGEPIAEVAIEPHGAELRGLELVLESPTSEGRFGYMFKNQPPHAASEDLLSALGQTMEERPLIGTNLADPETGEPVLQSDSSPVVATKDHNDALGGNPSPGADVGIHLRRSVHRPRHHVRHHDAQRAAVRPQRHDQLPHAPLRPRRDLRTGAEQGPPSSTIPTTGTSSGSSSVPTARSGAFPPLPMWSTTCRATPTARRSWRTP